MKNIIQKVPLPICGVMLGTATLGNLLQSYSEGIRYVCGILSAFLLLLLALKIVMFPKKFAEDMGNPIMASVFATCPMGIMLLSTYIKPFIGGAAYYIWLLAIAMHICLIVWFTIKFIIKFDLKKVFASYFIVYVGIAAAAITAPAYEKTSIGTAAFWFAFVSLLILLVLVTCRYLKHREIPQPAAAIICIYTAPAALCTAGYVQSVTPKSYGLLMTLFAMSLVLYIFAFVRSLSLLKLPFYPSISAFTFPFAISAVASKQTMACLQNMDKPMPVLQYLVLFQTVVAVIYVVYAYYRYMAAIFGTAKKQ